MKLKYLIAFILSIFFCMPNLLSQSYTYNIKIAAHIVRNAQGQYGIDTIDLTTSIQQVNTVYTTYNNSDIYFQLAYYDYIDSDTYTTGELINFEPTNYVFQQKLQNLFNEKNNVGLIHVYFIKKSFTTGAYAGVSENIPGYKIVITNEDAINEETLAHEIGHCLGLLHTYEGTKFNIQPTNDVFWTDGGIPNKPEWVARQGFPCSNSITNGDLLDDTPADPIYDESGISKFIQNCNFHNNNNIRDNSNCQNLYTGVLINNIMAYPTGCSRWQFTGGQIARMKAFLNDRLKSINNVIVVAVANKTNGTVIPNTNEKPSTLAIDAFNYNSGSKVYLNQVSHSGKTNQERFVNYQSNNIKHHDWNNNFSEFHLLENFTPTVVTPFRDANFLNMRYGKIEAKLEGSFINDKGDFQFHDPWYALSDNSQPENYWISATSMYEPNGKEGATEKGVFLNQTPDPNNPNKPYYSVGAISPQPIEINGRTHNFYFQNWSANPSGSAEFQDANALQTPVVFKQEGATVQANMKGTQLSNDQTAFANNGQRKFVRTQNGNLHCVYESMEMVWYEKSTDGGVNWSEPKRISNYNSKERNPAMDYINDKLCIVYEEYDEEITALMFCEFEDGGMVDYTEIKQINDINMRYSPVVAANEVNVVVVWKEALSNSLKLKHKYFTGTGWVWSEETTIPNTDINSQSPTIAISKLTMPLQSPNKSYCKLAWVNFDSEEKSSIEFYNIEIVDGSSTIEFKDHAEIALRSGFSRNHSPSIVEFNGGARVCWIGQRDEYPSFPEGDKGKTVVFTDPDNVGRYWTFGSNVNSVSINRSSSCYAIAWATDNNNERIHYTDCNTLRDFYSLNIIGKHVQLSNGTTPNTMQALAFNTSNLPYYMQTEQLYTDPEPIYVEEKREGIVSEADAQVYFNIGDIEVDGEKVGFLGIPDTVNITSQQTANQYLVSLPFSLTDNSEFFYSVKYGLTDSLAALSMLSGGKSISFKVELLDAQTNEVLGVFDEVTYDQGNLIPYEKIDYQVLTNGIGERLVKMRLIINSNFTPSYSVAEKYEEPSGLAKKSYKQIGYQGSLAVKEYALEQNYPNPFNPSTTIRWQSPIASHQTIKVYDVLGREVATLVNEWKDAGRYSVEFDASNLASGVYIYQLRINDYVATKKLLMIK